MPTPAHTSKGVKYNNKESYKKPTRKKNEMTNMEKNYMLMEESV